MKKRMNFELEEKAYKRLEWLKKKTEASSQAEVFRKALIVYEKSINRSN